MSDNISVTLTLSSVPHAARVKVEIHVDDSPAVLRRKASEVTKIPLDIIKLIFRGRLIGKEDDTNVIKEYKIEQDSVIHCMGKPVEDTPTISPSNDLDLSTAGASITFTSAPFSSTSSIPPAVSSVPETLGTALRTLHLSNPSHVYLTSLQTLEKILSNVAQNPLEEKYRRVKKGNAAFQKRLGGLVGGEAAMLALGFTLDSIDGEQFYVLHPNPDAWPKLVEHKAQLERAIQSASLEASATIPNPNPPTLNVQPQSLFAGSDNIGSHGSGMPPSLTPQMQQMMAQFMSNPEQLRTMLQNPAVQNMIRNDPRLANNPMMQQGIDQMMNNPQMMNQIAQMMQNPNLMNSFMGGMGASGGNVPSSPSSPLGTTRTDEEMTEEEMLEEAIRRSLSEQ